MSVVAPQTSRSTVSFTRYFLKQVTRLLGISTVVTPVIGRHTASTEKDSRERYCNQLPVITMGYSPIGSSCEYIGKVNSEYVPDCYGIMMCTHPNKIENTTFVGGFKAGVFDGYGVIEIINRKTGTYINIGDLKNGQKKGHYTHLAYPFVSNDNENTLPIFSEKEFLFQGTAINDDVIINAIRTSSHLIEMGRFIRTTQGLLLEGPAVILLDNGSYFTGYILSEEVNRIAEGTLYDHIEQAYLTGEFSVTHNNAFTFLHGTKYSFDKNSLAIEHIGQAVIPCEYNPYQRSVTTQFNNSDSLFTLQSMLDCYCTLEPLPPSNCIPYLKRLFTSLPKIDYWTIVIFILVSTPVLLLFLLYKTQQELKNTKKQLDNANNQLQRLTDSLSDSSNTDDMTAQIQQLQKQNTALKIQLKKLKDTIMNLESKTAQLKEKSEENINIHLEREKTANITIDKLTTELEATLVKFEKIKTDLEAQITERDNRIHQMESKISGLGQNKKDNDDGFSYFSITP